MFDFNSRDDFRSIDSQNMFDILSAFPEQISEAVTIGKNSSGFSGNIKSNKFAILGMGGSAIGGDLLASYLAKTNGAGHIMINTFRNYTIPGFINDETNVIASSYSGGTEETIAAFTEALVKTQNLVCITTGGKLGEIAGTKSVPIIKIPSGLQPRCAVGFSFFPMLYLILKTDLINNETEANILNDIESTKTIIKKRSLEYTKINSDNRALNIAKKIYGTIPVIYSSVDGMEAVNTRWIRQIQENAKHLVFGGLLPEMNHNEINSFSLPDGLPKKISVIFISDKSDHERTQKRFDALANLIGESVHQIITVQSDDDSFLARMFDILYLGDWVSYYLAILNKVDPTPIPLITKLKNILADS